MGKTDLTPDASPDMGRLGSEVSEAVSQGPRDRTGSGDEGGGRGCPGRVGASLPACLTPRAVACSLPVAPPAAAVLRGRVSRAGMPEGLHTPVWTCCLRGGVRLAGTV